MKALLIFLFVSLTAGDKLNPAYLPPLGAKYSGGGEDNEAPFEVPVGNFGLKDENATRLTPGIFREGGITSSYRTESGGRITSSTYAPISDGRITSPTYSPSGDGGIIPSTYGSTADGRTIPSTYSPTTDGKIIPSTLAPTSDGRIIPSTYSLTPGRFPTSTYSPDSNGKISSNYKPISDGRIISSTYAPTTYPSTNSNYNSYFTTPGPYGQSFHRVTDGLSNRPNEENGYSPNQYSKDVNTKLPVSSENQFENDDYDTRRPVSFGPASIANNNGGENSFINNKAIGAARYPERKARPQEEADRNAVILNNENIITPDGYFAYSFDTSNGIHADESGAASDGVKANGSYSYIGDDGKLYNLTYSADEYGFQPRGDHLPTPPPVPDAILKVIEQAAKDRDNGIFDDGSYDERKYGFKKYQPLRDRILGNNGSQQEPSSRPSKISLGNTSSKTDGVTLPNSQENGYYNVNQKGTNVIKPNESTNQSPYEAARDYNDEYNQDSQRPGFPSTVGIPVNRIDNYNDSRDKNYNTPSTDVDQKNRNYYDADGLSGPKGTIVTDNQNQNENEPDLENTFTETQNGYSYPNPNRQFGERIPYQPSKFDQNKNNLGYPQKPNQFATSRPTEYYTPTTEKSKIFGANADRIKGYTNSPPSTERVRDSTTFTDRPRDYYSPSTTERLNGLDTYTDRPRDYYSPSTDGITSTERIKPTGPFTRPSNYSNRPSTSIQQFGSYTDGPGNNFYNPTSTGSVNEFGTYTNRPDDYNTGVVREFDIATGRPSTYYVPSSTNTESGSSAGRPKDVYSSSTQGTIDFDQTSGRPNNNYNSLPTQRKDFGTDRPNDYYNPTSTEIRKGFSTVTDRPGYYYGPTSTERIRPTGAFTRPGDYYTPTSTIVSSEIGTYTVRPTNYRYRPTSTERINEVNIITGKPSDYSGPGGSLNQPSDYYNGPSTKQTVTGRPIDYYGPSSTQRLKDFDTATGKPTYYYGPSSTDRIKDFDTATGRPIDYYGPSSTERIKAFDTATGRPIDYYGPSSTERVKAFDTATGRPIDYYIPSSTDRIKTFDTATGQPIDFKGPSSTDRLKYYDTATGRPTDYFSPSSTDKITAFDTATGQPIDSKGPSSTDRIKYYVTATGRPTDYFSPSSTNNITAFDTATGQPIDFKGLSSTDRIKYYDTATGRPTDYFSPSSTDKITAFETATGRPIDFNGPSSTESVKDFGRPNEYYGPSSTERIKYFGTATGRPTEYYGPSSTERINGEDFSGPKQPQRYDPETGYYY